MTDKETEQIINHYIESLMKETIKEIKKEKNKMIEKRKVIAEKLKSMGYKNDKSLRHLCIFIKPFTDKFLLTIEYIFKDNKIVKSWNYVWIEGAAGASINSQQQIDELQVAFNRLQVDLKELQEWKKENMIED